MEDLRELLNIYFSDEPEEEQEGTESIVYENTYQSFYSSFLNEEKYITNIFENILKERDREFNKAFENVIEKAYEGAGKIGGVSASVYFSDYSEETGENKAVSFYNENYNENIGPENIQSIQNNENNENNGDSEAVVLNETNETGKKIAKQNINKNLSSYFEESKNVYKSFANNNRDFFENSENINSPEYKTEISGLFGGNENITNITEDGDEIYNGGQGGNYGGSYNGNYNSSYNGSHNSSYNSRSNYNEEILSTENYLNDNFSENIYNSENKPGEAEGFDDGADFSAFVPSYTTALNNFYDEVSEGDSFKNEAGETAALNNYYEETAEGDSFSNEAFETSGLNNYYEGAGDDNFISEALEETALNRFYEKGAEDNSAGETLRDILNTYSENEFRGLNITNNISPAFNIYGAERGSDINIEEIADKIGEMLAEAASASAGGFYK